MYNKTIIRFGFCDILNNQSLGKCYQPRPSARLIKLTSTLIIPDITITLSNNCLISTEKGIAEGAVAQLFLQREKKKDGRFHTLCKEEIAEFLPKTKQDQHKYH